ncbi:hypothetical protein HK405_010212, partial [Cladochytrium tenue]
MSTTTEVVLLAPVDHKGVGAVGAVGATVGTQPAAFELKELDRDCVSVRDSSSNGGAGGWITLVGTSAESATMPVPGPGGVVERQAVEDEPGVGYEGGVFQDRLVADGLAPSSTLVWIGSAQASVEALLVLPGDRFVAAYGPRRVALVGTFFAAAGPIVASFCTNSVIGLILTEGLMFGLGQALCFYAVATLPATYFLRRRNLAMGIMSSGAAVGGAVFSIVTAQLLRSLSLAWTFRAIGLIFLALNLPAALALRSRSPAEPLRRSGRRMLDRTLFKDKRFTLLLVGSAIALFPLFVPPFFLPLYASSVGLSTTVSSLILA